MRASIFTSDRHWRTLLLASLAVIACSVLFASPVAADESKPEKKEDKSLQAEEDDFAPSPFTEYGEFNQEEEEAADARFFQHGRFFGVSVGTGFEGIAGNRGVLWNGGLPMFDFRIHYWFDFNVALDLGLFTAPHYYDSRTQGGHVDARMFFVGVHIKYYFDTKNLSSAITFANPYLLAGGGSFNKSESVANQDESAVDSAVGFTVGGGMEFPIKARKVYLNLEARYSFVTFKDTYYSKFQQEKGIPDLTGGFYNLVAAIMFTW